MKKAIQELEKYFNYCKTKTCPRNNETLEAIKDCILVLQGNFSTIRARDIQFEKRSSRKK